MRVAHLSARNFMRYESMELDLPETGLVLVTGPNGQGKSALVEMVAQGFWGKTLRGTSPWRAGHECNLSVLSSTHTVAWKVTKSDQKQMSWSRRGEEDGAALHKHTTEGLKQLECEIGEQELWRRCCVFSGLDEDLFGESTDGQRKKLLERLLGLERFDGALKSCRLALRSESDSYAIARTKLYGHQEALEIGLQSVQTANQGTKVDRAEVQKLFDKSAKLSSIKKRLDEALEQHREAAKDLARAEAVADNKVEELREQLEQLADRECPTCGQHITDEVRTAIEKKIEAKAHKAEEAKQHRQEGERLVKAITEDLRGEREDVEAKLLSVRNESARLQEKYAAAEKAQAAVEKMKNRLAEVGQQIAATQSELDQHKSEVSVLTEVEKVLGMGGVRSRLLGRTLAGIEDLASSYLSRVSGKKLGLRLSPTKQNKDGGETQSITLEIEGAGGGYGYKAASLGQRRRIDAVFVLALAKVSGAALAKEPGTLWLDEVLDRLDEEGIEAFSELVLEISQERPVVLISHSASLVRALRPQATLRLSVQDHKLQER